MHTPAQGMTYLSMWYAMCAALHLCLFSFACMHARLLVCTHAHFPLQPLIMLLLLLLLLLDMHDRRR